MSQLEEKFILLWRQICGYSAPQPTRQYKFLTDRKFAFDFAWPERKIAVECEGGIFAPRGKCCPACGQPPRSRHTTGTGFERDCEKYNLAADAGWIVYRVTAHMLQADPAKWIEIISEKIKENLT